MAAAAGQVGYGVAKSPHNLYLESMNLLFPILIGAAMLMTLGVLAAGVVNMARSGPDAARRSNKLMQWRVILQGIALLLFAIAMMLGPR